MVTNYTMKLNAKLSLSKNYLKLIFASFIILLCTTGAIITERLVCGFGTSTFFQNLFRSSHIDQAITIKFIIVRASFIFINFLLLKPLIVLSDKIFYLNSFESTEKITLKEVFNINFKLYFKYVLVYLYRSILLTFYLILLIIPGFIKYYEFKALDYVLFNKPELSVKETFDEANKITKGMKYKALLMDLSFLPLLLLSVLTLGIFHVLYIGPYYRASYMELFEWSSNREEYRVKYPDSKLYHLTSDDRGKIDIFLGLVGEVLIVISNYFLYQGSSIGGKVGLYVNISWLNVRTFSYVLSILIACAATPLLFKGMTRISKYSSKKLGGPYGPKGGVQHVFRLSISLSVISTLAVHIALSSAPILFRLLNTYTTIDKAIMITNDFASYLTIPIAILYYVPNLLVSIIFMYLVCSGSLKIKKWTMIFNPLIFGIVNLTLSRVIPVYFIQDMFKMLESIGWFLMFLMFYISYNRDVFKKEDKTTEKGEVNGQVL